jgi:hypothetical protein
LSSSASSLATRGLTFAIAGVLSATSAFAQAAPAAPAPKATLAKSAYMFTGDAALTVNVVKADRTADFEKIVGKLQEALQKSVRPERVQQAASWKVFKASEPGPSGSSIYVFLIDPVVADSDYTPSAILAEGFPEDVRPLYKALSDSLASLTIFNLSLVSDFGK